MIWLLLQNAPLPIKLWWVKLMVHFCVSLKDKTTKDRQQGACLLAYLTEYLTLVTELPQTKSLAPTLTLMPNSNLGLSVLILRRFVSSLLPRIKEYVPQQ